MDSDGIDYLGEFLFRASRWLVVIFVPLVFAAGFAVRGCMAPEPAQPPDPKPVREYYQQCRTCGEWLYAHAPPSQPIDSCPLCPLSVEEFEELQRRLREERDP